jgi:hypothetical protein
MTNDATTVLPAPGPTARQGKSAIGFVRIASKLRRGEYFGGLFLLACVSGFASKIVESVNRLGWSDSLFNTFTISVIVWMSCIAGVSLSLRDRTVGVRSLELALGVGFVFLVILPIGQLSWIAVTGLSLYILVSTNVPSSRRGAIILLAITVPMLWSRMLFQVFASSILRADALFVAWLLGTDRNGNVVEFADSSGHLVILTSCSSLTNVSLAFLCWITLSRLMSYRKSIYDALWCLLACTSVVAVNVTRLAILALSQQHYTMFHTQWANLVTNLIVLGLIVGISALGVRRELLQRT